MQVATSGIKRCRGFSLIELMMVTLATGILAAVVWKAASSTIEWANTSRMSIEVSQLSKAIDNFCLRIGDYPPDFSDQMAVWKFMKARFPKCPREKYPDFSEQSPATALYFWLGGPDGRGFSVDPANPFDTKGKRMLPFFNFDKERVKTIDDGVTEYLPPNKKQTPYLYFRGSGKGYDKHPGWEFVKPYRDSVKLGWIDGAKYQILCPGNDGKYGAGNFYPGGPDYDAANMDDITSFSRGRVLRDEIPTLLPSKKKEEGDDLGR